MCALYACAPFHQKLAQDLTICFLENLEILLLWAWFFSIFSGPMYGWALVREWAPVLSCSIRWEQEASQSSVLVVPAMELHAVKVPFILFIK